MKDHLIQPYGGSLINLIVENEKAEELKTQSNEWLSWDLTDRQICDLELLLNGGFSPLTGFMGKVDYESVCTNMRLHDGTLWPLPITLDVTDDVADKVQAGSKLALRHPEGILLAVLHIEDKWKADKKHEAKNVLGSVSAEHPGVRYLLNDTHPWYLGGKIEGIQLPEHYDFSNLRLTPADLRHEFSRTRNPMHRAHYELTLRAGKEHESNLLIHPVVGMTKPGDIDHYTRVRCYQALLPHYPKHTVKLSLLPLAMRMGGPISP